MENIKQIKKNDKKLIIILILIALTGYGITQFLQNLWADDEATAVVSYDNSVIMIIELSDGTSEIFDSSRIYTPSEDETNATLKSCLTDSNRFCVIGELGPVVIEYRNNQVTVIEETSPYNTCRTHGPSNSPARPIICLPNRITISIQSPNTEDDAFVRRKEQWNQYTLQLQN